MIREVCAEIQKQTDKHSVSELCEIYGVSRSGYYKWLKRAGQLNRYEKTHKILDRYVLDIHSHHPMMGYRQIRDKLYLEFGWIVSDPTVWKSMKRLRIHGYTRRRKATATGTNLEHIRYANVLNRKFKAEKPIITRYVVRDNGIGMSEEYQKKLFDPFSQEDDANARTQYKGTGLGMAITKKYVDMMGGSIAVESKKGVGSTFTVEIPLELSEQVIQSEQKQYLHRDLTGIHVLMAEDNDLNAELATMILEDAGITVTRASDGKEVVDLFKNHPRGTYDLILMDIMMPNMDGHQAAKAIRALGIERSDAVTIPIIALSANAFIDDIQESLDSGMNDHISKPINMEELIDTITKYIKRD